VGFTGRKGAALLVGFATLVAAVLVAPASGADAAQQSQRQPNVVVLLSDDQTVEEMRYMPEAQRLIGAAGTTFTTNMTNWPLCCPSRATMLSGQYAHNHGVLGNVAPLGGFGNFDTAHALPVWLRQAGYYTAHVGKLMNGYEQSDVGVPPGWSEWHGSKNTYRYYGMVLLENGRRVTYGNPRENTDDPADPDSYNSVVYTDKAVDIIERRAPGSRPFYLSVSYLAPHSGGPHRTAGEEPARCEGTAKPPIDRMGELESTPLPQPPSFNEADVSDKPAAVATLPPLSPQRLAATTRNYRCRGESVIGVDDGVARVIGALRASGELRNTIVVYTSDNGFFHGEHRIPSGKNQVYEEAVRVPLLIRGPGFPRGAEVDDVTINADLVPTIVDAAGARTDLPQDGRSLLPFAKHPDRYHGRGLLIEQKSPEGEGGEPLGTEYAAIRTNRYKLVDNATGEIELYDLLSDPYELDNRHGDPAYAEAEAALSAELAALRRCAGRSCRTAPDVKLRLPREVRRGGRRCIPASRFDVAVRNRADAAIVAADFRVRGRRAGSATVVPGAPVTHRIRARTLRRGVPRPLLEADVELADGRIRTLVEHPRICR